MHCNKARRIDPNSAEGQNIKRFPPKPLFDVVPAALDARQKITFQPALANLSTTNQLSTITDFEKWLSVFFVLKGAYKITQRAFEHFRTVLRHGTEKGEVAKHISSLIIDGAAAELLDEGYIERPTKLSWKQKETRVVVVKRLVELTTGIPAKLSSHHFKSAGLSGLLDYYGGSVYLALVESDLAYSIEEIKKHSTKGEFPSAKIYVWQAGGHSYSDPEIRIAAVKWLIQKLIIEPDKIQIEHFHENGLSAMINHYYSGSVYAALIEAGFAHSLEEIRSFSLEDKYPDDKIYFWQMKKSPRVYGELDIRVAATRWLVKTSGKKATELTYGDMTKALPGLLPHIQQQAVYFALADAQLAYSLADIRKFSEARDFPRDKLYPWNMRKKPKIYDDNDICIAATRWLVYGKGKNPREINNNDFVTFGISTVLSKLPNRSIYLAFVQAGIAYSFDEIKSFSEYRDFPNDKIYPWHMSRSAPLYGDTHMRIAAMRWLSASTGKPVQELKMGDFSGQHFGGLLRYYRADKKKLEGELARAS